MYLWRGQCDITRLRQFTEGAVIAWNERKYGCTHLTPPAPWKAAMLCCIRPDGSIPFHSDRLGEDHGAVLPGTRRFHIVLETNSRCWVYHDDHWQQLALGGIYQMDPTREHAAINFGDTERRHLIVDVEHEDALWHTDLLRTGDTAVPKKGVRPLLRNSGDVGQIQGDAS